MDRLEWWPRINLAWFTVGAVNVTRLSKTDKSSLPRPLSSACRRCDFPPILEDRRSLTWTATTSGSGIRSGSTWQLVWILDTRSTRLPAKKRSLPPVDVFRLGGIRVHDGGSIVNKLSLYIGEMEPDGRGWSLVVEGVSNFEILSLWSFDDARVCL